MLTPHRVPSSDLEHARALSKRLLGVEVEPDEEALSAAEPDVDYVDLADATPVRASIEPMTIASNTAEALAPEVEALEPELAREPEGFAAPIDEAEPDALAALGLEEDGPEPAFGLEADPAPATLAIEEPTPHAAANEDADDAFSAILAEADPEEEIADLSAELAEDDDASALAPEPDASFAEMAAEPDEAPELSALSLDADEEDDLRALALQDHEDEEPPLVSTEPPASDEPDALAALDAEPGEPAELDADADASVAFDIEADDDPVLGQLAPEPTGAFDAGSPDEDSGFGFEDASESDEEDAFEAVFSPDEGAPPAEAAVGGDDGFDLLEMAFDEEPEEAAAPTPAAERVEIDVPSELQAALDDASAAVDDDDGLPLEFELDDGDADLPISASGPATAAAAPADAPAPAEDEDEFDNLFSEILEDD